MRRTNAVQQASQAPTKGILNQTPPDFPASQRERYLSLGENVRAQKGKLHNAPGYERIHLKRKDGRGGLTEEVSLIYQPAIIADSREAQTDPVVGTASSLFSMRKRGRVLTCPAGCSVTFAAVADSGNYGAPAGDVAKLIRGWSPDVLVHAGDLAYVSGGSPAGSDLYDTQVATHYQWALDEGKILPTPGNHDYTDGPLARYLEFFHLSPGARWYSVKKGPVQFFFVDSYGPQTGAAAGVGQLDLSATSDQAVWLQTELAASDCPWRVVVWHHPPQTSEANYWPGLAVMDWPIGTWGANLLITGHSHVYERLLRADGATHLIVGLGGQSIRTFHDPVLGNSQARYAGDYGALKVQASGTALTASFFSRDGTQQDTVSLTTARPLTVCYQGALGRTMTQLDVVPSTAAVEVGSTFQLQAVARFTDGTSADVTSVAGWEVHSTAVATVTSGGLARGVGIGGVVVKATYEGVEATGWLQVYPRCVDDPMDLGVAIGCGQTMLSRRQQIVSAVSTLAGTLRTGDALTVSAFGSGARLVSTLADSPSLAATKLAGETFSGTRPADSGFGLAVNEVTGVRHVAGRKQAVVLFIDGEPDSVPALTAAVSWARGQSVVIGVVLLSQGVSSGTASTLQAYADPGYFYSVASADDLPRVFADIRGNLCRDLGGYFGGATQSSPQLDYRAFTNWDVTAGNVDLCGMGGNGVAVWDVFPGNGLYVDMLGYTSRGKGTLQSKVAYSFTAGKTYRISLKVSGNGRDRRSQPYAVRVAVGTYVTNDVTVTNWAQPFTLYSWNFVPGSSGTAKISIRQLTSYFGNVGLYIDDVKLENVTDNAVMLLDTFDNENQVNAGTGVSLSGGL
jgi:tartrate-resistant acid phosphatase type 5